MVDLDPHIQDEFNRALKGAAETSWEPRAGCLDINDILRAHFLIANHFYLEGEGIGGVGPRDFGLLESAIHRQVSSFCGQDRWTGPFDVSATLFYGLIKNHPFYDANKRTAFLSLLFQLQTAGWTPAVGEKVVEDFTVEIAENGLDRHRRFVEMKKSGPDPEIRFISYWVRKHFRKLDRNNYAVTYRELQKILNRYDFHLEKAHGNYIDIISRKPSSTSILGFFKRERISETKVGQIGFPRWTAQVGSRAIKSVRSMTGLTHEQGVDSGAFFNGLDPLQGLITTYQEPLRRLAGR